MNFILQNTLNNKGLVHPCLYSGNYTVYLLWCCVKNIYHILFRIEGILRRIYINFASLNSHLIQYFKSRFLAYLFYVFNVSNPSLNLF